MSLLPWQQEETVSLSLMGDYDMSKQTLFQKILALTASVHQVASDFTKDIKSGDITPVQYSILEYIAFSQPVTLSDISDCLHTSMPNSSREVKKLIAKNLCIKVEAPEDRRKQYIHLSSEGQAMMDLVFQQIEGKFQQRIQSASDKELLEIERAVEVLHAKVFYNEGTAPKS